VLYLIVGAGHNLDVKTQMSETIWLEPSSEKTVYLQIRNTSDKDMSGLQTKITSELAAKGYRVQLSGHSLLLDSG
jgi:hypothetical protein